jgi:ABC-type lipoprotein release transport system permease subunit
MRWLERQRSILDFTLSSLARRKSKNLALLFVYALVVFAAGSVLLFTHALRAESGTLLRGAPELLVQRMAAGRHDMIPAERVEQLASLRGVSAARGRLWGYYYDEGSRANYTLLVPEKFWAGGGQVVVGEGVSRVRGVGQGGRLTFRAYDGSDVTLAVREVMRSDSGILSSDVVMVSDADFRRVFGMSEGVFTDVALTVPNSREVATVAAKVTRLFPDVRAVSRSEILRTYDTIFDWRSGFVVALLTAAVLAFAVVAWDKAAGLSAGERREIGILKAIGWETSDVLLMKVWEGAVISLSAFGIGILAAYVHVFCTPVVLFRPVLQGWSALYPRFELVPFVDAGDLATLFLLTVAPYVAATVVPAWRAATTDPDAVMRS